jgi:poly(3-hydroxybutyrate) depolymerase
MFRKIITLIWTIVLVPSLMMALPKGVTKETLTVNGSERSYFLFIPEGLDQATPAPVILLLAGSGRDGWSLVKKWRKLAKKEGIVLVGPNAADPRGWSSKLEGPGFLRAVIEHAGQKAPIDDRRIYIFGHSAGACWALYLAIYDSEYYAAVAVHAGMLNPSHFAHIETARRKTPISLQVGTRDRFFPLEGVRATRDEFEKNGFTVELTEIPNHTHWYYDSAKKINARAWEFLKRHRRLAISLNEKH